MAIRSLFQFLPIVSETKFGASHFLSSPWVFRAMNAPPGNTLLTTGFTDRGHDKSRIREGCQLGDWRSLASGLAFYCRRPIVKDVEEH